ncbi:cache domain-containing protein [Primorskyibacter sp. 2E107]|uniref:cache domain-containing protein n=1 Tax=Primorskyibacter sp. 2E107 TaxID=3403458 RepID=UPI003AF50D70
MITRRTLLTTTLAVAALPAFAIENTVGTREEAMAMAKRAHDFYNENGREAAIAAFMDPADTRFRDRDLYVWSMAFDGMMLAHGATAALAGKNLITMRDVDGIPLTANAVKVAQESGTGWIDYKWRHPETGEVLAKSAYVMKVNDDAFVSVGIYLP